MMATRTFHSQRRAPRNQALDQIRDLVLEMDALTRRGLVTLIVPPDSGAPIFAIVGPRIRHDMNSEQNPYKPPESDCSRVGNYPLLCPYCGLSFSLTWRRYFFEPSSVHQCPHCKMRSRLRSTAKYRAKLLAATTVLMMAGGSLAVTAFFFFGWAASIVVAALGVAALWSLDRRFDTERPLDKMV